MKAKLWSKMNAIDRAKVRARYDMMYNEFLKLSEENLKEVYNRVKLSSSEREALIMATAKVQNDARLASIESSEEKIVGEGEE